MSATATKAGVGAYFRVEICYTSDNAGTAYYHSRDQPIALSREGAELFWLEQSTHSADFRNPTAGKLNTDDVLVSPQTSEHVRINVKASNDIWKVVNENAKGARISELEERQLVSNCLSLRRQPISDKLTSSKNATIASFVMAKWK